MAFKHPESRHNMLDEKGAIVEKRRHNATLLNVNVNITRRRENPVLAKRMKEDPAVAAAYKQAREESKSDPSRKETWITIRAEKLIKENGPSLSQQSSESEVTRE